MVFGSPTPVPSGLQLHTSPVGRKEEGRGLVSALSPPCAALWEGRGVPSSAAWLLQPRVWLCEACVSLRPEVTLILRSLCSK